MCKINECENKIHAKGLCSMHYMRWWTHGDPLFTKHHGYRNHPLYKVLENMKTRCYNKNYPQYKDWGGRGIVVCDEWMNPKTFIKWGMDNGWEKGLQIDRRDNDGNYCPENCRFVTRIKNTHNQRLLQENNTSGYCGVSYYKNSDKWIARIYFDNKKKYLGCFDIPEEAAIAYDKAIPDNRPRNFIT